MRTKIYALYDEFDYVRYIGKTVQPLAKRYLSHMHEAQRGVHTHKCNWIRSMIHRGFAPAIRCLRIVTGNGNTTEKHYIQQYRQLGVSLVNQLPGGGGIPKGYKFSETTKRRMSIAHRGSKNHFFGKRHSETTKKLIAEKARIRNLGKANPNYGNHILRGRKRPTHSLWMRKHNPFAGRHHTEATKAKIRLTKARLKNEHTRRN